MKNTLQKIFVVGIMLLTLTALSGCNVFKVNVNPVNNIVTYNISAHAVEGGTITGAGTYLKNASVTLNAIPSEGYAFLNWTRAGNIVHTQATYTFTATENITLIANFEALPEPFSITNYFLQTNTGDNISATEFKADGSYLTYLYTFDEVGYEVSLSNGINGRKWG